MNTIDLVQDLMSEGVEFATDGKTIRWRNSGGRMTPQTIAEIAAAKPEVIDFLTRRARPEMPLSDKTDRQAAKHPSAGEKPRPDPVSPAPEVAQVARAYWSKSAELAPLQADLETYLAMLADRGPMTYGAAATALGWGATRAWAVEASLQVSKEVQIDERGRAALMKATKLSLRDFG